MLHLTEVFVLKAFNPQLIAFMSFHISLIHLDHRVSGKFLLPVTSPQTNWIYNWDKSASHAARIIATKTFAAVRVDDRVSTGSARRRLRLPGVGGGEQSAEDTESLPSVRQAHAPGGQAAVGYGRAVRASERTREASGGP